MSYIGRQNLGGAYRQLDDISSGFDGSDTTHTMQVNSQNVTVGDVNQIILSLGGVIQNPGTDFTVSGSVLTFTTAPASGTSFFAILLGSDNGGTVTPTDLSVTTAKIAADAITSAKIADDAVTGDHIASSGAFTIGAALTGSSIAGLPIYVDSSNGSVYTHDVSGTDNTAEGNAAYGLQALDAITTGDYNTAIGYQALSANNTGYSNVALGQAALLANTEGYENISIGKSSLLSNTTGDRNIAIGVRANDLADTEIHNVSIGYESMTSAVAGGEYNVCVGSYSGYAITSADHNVLIGYAAGYDLQGGGAAEGFNTCVGNNSGAQLTTGFENICIGHSAGNGSGNSVGTDPTTGYRNILIGPYSNTTASDALHSIVIGYGISGAAQDFTFGRSSNVVSNDFDADANWSRSSDVRKKRNINDQGLGLDFIKDLRTVNFQWKPSNEFPKEWKDYSEENNMDLDRVMHGFIAQEVKEALDKHASDQDKNFTGWTVGEDGMQNTSREMFVIPLIKAVQELSAQVEELKAKLEDK